MLLGVIVAGGLAVAADPSPALAAGPVQADPSPAPAPRPSPIPPPPTGTPSPAPDLTPGPTQGPTPPGWNPPTDSTDDPGLFDIPGQIRKAIAGFFVWVAATGLKPVLGTLGSTVLATPDLTSNPQVQAVWTTSLVAANAVFVLFIVGGGLIVASRETLQTRYGLKEVLPRLAVAGVVTNISLIVCGKAIETANALTAVIAGQGVDGPAAATAINQALAKTAQGSNFLVSLLILAALVMVIIVVNMFILRIAMLVLLIGVAPLALLCHATPQTEGLAYAWWRALGACLAIQVGQAVILLATLKVFLTPTGPTTLGVPSDRDGLLGILVCLSMLWLLIKLPGWTRQFVLGPLAQRHGGGLFWQILRTILIVKTFGRTFGRSRRRRGRTPPVPRPRPNSRGPRPGGGGP
jgi:hypothetical protein